MCSLGRISVPYVAKEPMLWSLLGAIPPENESNAHMCSLLGAKSTLKGSHRAPKGLSVQGHRGLTGPHRACRSQGSRGPTKGP